jgi:hypothetical protein
MRIALGIVWIASYPKSGNTWVRAFLANYAADGDQPVDINALSDFGHSDGNVKPYEIAMGRPFGSLSDQEIARARPRVQTMLSANGSHVPVKTHAAIGTVHGAPTINMAMTSCAIYIVRNPLDVVLSYADHYGLTHAEATNALMSPTTAIARSNVTAPEHLGDWATHVRSWTGTPSPILKVLRYEDMHLAPEQTFAAMLPFMGFKLDSARLTKAVRHARFKELARQETDAGFREKSASQQRFFRSGEFGHWRAQLAPDLVEKLTNQFRPEMQRFGYLDASGNPI